MQKFNVKNELDMVSLLEKGEILLKDGNYSGAETIFREILESAPRNLSALKNLGKTYFYLKDYKNSAKYYRDSLKIDNSNSEAYFFLGQTCINMGLISEGEEFVNEAFKLDRKSDEILQYLVNYFIKNKDTEKLNSFFPFICKTENVEILNDAGRYYLENDKNEKGYDLLRKSAEFKENQTEINKILKNEKQTRLLKIAVFSRNDFFLKDILEYLGDKFDVQVCKDTSPVITKDLMDSVDLAWIEWCDDLAVQLSMIESKCKKIIRLHSYEVFTNFPNYVKWKNINELLFVSDIVKDVFTERFPGIKVNTQIIPNGLDFDRFKPDFSRKKGNKICFTGQINYKKNPALMLECFKMINEYDPGYEFYIAGEHQDPRFKLYFDDMVNKLDLKINFSGWIKNIPYWLKDKDYIISTSLFESFQYSVAEGIASGLLPLIHWWKGAENIYSEDTFFLTANECVDVLRKYEKGDRVKLNEKYRNSLKERFSVEKINKEIFKFIEGLGL